MAIIARSVLLAALGLILVGAGGFMFGAVGLTTYHGVALVATIAWFAAWLAPAGKPKPDEIGERTEVA